MSTCWSCHPYYVERLEAEIERLRARNTEHEERYQALESLGLRHDRAAVIEECAKVAERYLEDDYTPPVMIDKIATAIRALKEKS